MNALNKAIANAGSATKLAELLSTSAMNVSHWRNRNGGRFPRLEYFRFFMSLV
jgi:hypothetical protein